MKAVDKLPPRSNEEIEADLVKIFGADRRPQIIILIDAQRHLAKLPPLTGNERSNKKFAKRLKAWVDDGNKIFAELPKDFNPHLLFAPGDGNPLDSEERILAMAPASRDRARNLKGMAQRSPIALRMDNQQRHRRTWQRRLSAGTCGNRGARNVRDHQQAAGLEFVDE
jgi:hypothetical protein